MKLEVTTRRRIPIELISLAALAFGCAAAPKSTQTLPPPAAGEPEIRVEENDAVITGRGSIPSRSSEVQHAGAPVEIWAQSFHLEGRSARTLREAKPDSHFSGWWIVPVRGDVRDFAIEFSDARDRSHAWPLQHVAVDATGSVRLLVEFAPNWRHVRVHVIGDDSMLRRVIDLELPDSAVPTTELAREPPAEMEQRFRAGWDVWGTTAKVQYSGFPIAIWSWDGPQSSALVEAWDALRPASLGRVGMGLTGPPNPLWKRLHQNGQSIEKWPLPVWVLRVYPVTDETLAQ